MEVLIDNAAFPTFWDIFFDSYDGFSYRLYHPKAFACMLFSDVIVEIGTSCFEESALT